MKKQSLSLIMLILSALIVYGAALVNKLFKGNFLLENGFSDIGYVLLTLCIAVPIILYIVVVNDKYKENVLKVSLAVLFFTSLLFIPVYTLAFETSFINSTELNRFTIIVLLMTIVFTAISHFELNKDE